MAAGRLFTDPRDVQILEIRYGMIRARALTPQEPAAFVENVRGDTQ